MVLTIRKRVYLSFILSGLALLCSCETFFRRPNTRDIKNIQSSVTIVQKQDAIETHTEAIKTLAKGTIVQAKDIQTRSKGGFQIPSWLYWVGGLCLLAYIGVLPLVLGIGIRIVHKIAKGLKEVDY